MRYQARSRHASTEKNEILAGEAAGAGAHLIAVRASVVIRIPFDGLEIIGVSGRHDAGMNPVTGRLPTDEEEIARADALRIVNEPASFLRGFGELVATQREREERH